MTQDHWWLAINGPSVAASPIPMESDSFCVKPTPEYLIGYSTRSEQLATQRFLLTAPINEVAKYMFNLPPHLPRYVCENPELPSRGQTQWISAPAEPTLCVLDELHR